MEKKNSLASFIQDASLFLLGILLIFFPLIFVTISTNPILLPKVALLGIAVLVLLLLHALLMIVEKSVKIRRTYFDIPVILFLFFVFISSVFSVNRADSLMAFVPFLFTALIYFLIVNIAKDKNSLLFLMSSLILGGVILSIFAITTFFKIYILPVASTHTQNFSPIGSTLDQGIYLFLVFAITVYFAWRLIKSNLNTSANSFQSSLDAAKATIFGIVSMIILIGVIVTIYSLITSQKPLILPFETGFQTAFAQISLDTGRIAQGFLMGSGFGTYFVDFSRWKQVAFNQNQDLWNITFFRSSSFVLELLATAGVLGISAFIFIAVKALKEVKKGVQNPLLLSLLAFFITSLLLPLGFINQALMFIILALFAGYQGLRKQENNRYFDVELQIVALKKGLISMDAPTKNEKSSILPVILTIIIILMVGVLGYYSLNYIISDIIFQKSLVAASQNNAQLTYDQQRDAISKFPYRDGFHRVFSQTNLAIANALAASAPKDVAPNTQAQQEIINLIQQSINSARTATTIAPQTYLNWQNLSSIYRSLVGFGQNAESFAIATAQQSLALDPNNPQQYIHLGGIYYQLQQWDNAQNQFLIATRLKPDFANSYYNLGHALEQKGDLENALSQYELVKRLVANDKNSLDQINKEISDLQARIKTNAETQETATTSSVSPEQTLNINTPPATLPKRTPPVKIPAPDVATKSSR